jgi:hypothetical protein
VIAESAGAGAGNHLRQNACQDDESTRRGRRATNPERSSAAHFRQQPRSAGDHHHAANHEEHRTCRQAARDRRPFADQSISCAAIDCPKENHQRGEKYAACVLERCPQAFNTIAVQSARYCAAAPRHRRRELQPIAPPRSCWAVPDRWPSTAFSGRKNTAAELSTAVRNRVWRLRSLAWCSAIAPCCFPGRGRRRYLR